MAGIIFPRPKRSILYYPTIDIPSGPWLRQAILYWDEVGSIVPERMEETGDLSYREEIRVLRDRGVFRPFRPEALTRVPRAEPILRKLDDEFRSLVTSSEFKKISARGRDGKKRTAVSKENFAFEWDIYGTKLSHELRLNFRPKFAPFQIK